MSRRSPIKLFEALDGRESSAELLYVRDGERAILISQGWDCEATCESISVYRFLHYPTLHRCEDAIIYKYETDVGDCCNTHTVVRLDEATGDEFPVTFNLGKKPVTLSCSSEQLIIDEPGQYLFHRSCGAEAVCVIAKYENCPSKSR